MDIRRYFKNVFARLHRRSPQFHVAFSEDIPEQLEDGLIYLVGSVETRWAAVFMCPCKCSARVQLNLLADVRPHWTASVHSDNSVSIRPSIRRGAGCRSHFWIDGGYVFEAFDSHEDRLR